MYLINNNTLYVERCGEGTIAREKTKVFSLNGDCLKELLDESCIHYGSSFSGRVKSSAKVLASNYNLPIVISEKDDLLFFPVDNSNIYLNFAQINFLENKESVVEIVFKNGERKRICDSFLKVNNQLIRASRIWFVYLL